MFDTDSDQHLEYTVFSTSEGLSLTVAADGESLAFGPDHPNLDQAVDVVDGWKGAAFDTETAVELLRDLNDVGVGINQMLREVSARFSYGQGDLRFDGDVIDKRLTRVILDRLNAGDEDWASYARFMVALATNPSAGSRQALYRWIADRHLTITAEGYVVGYKGVGDDGYSIHSGKGTVHRRDDGGELVSESYDGQRLPNEVGSWVEFPRAEVDPDPDSPCSVGLHVGSESFARGYGQRLLTVLVDPAAVVMVPRDADGQKMRVWQYHVTDIEPASALAVHTLSAPVAFVPLDEEDDDAFSGECDECGEDHNIECPWGLSG